MKPPRQRNSGKGGLELIEQAIHLLRGAPPVTLASYYLGAFPFVLGLLYFWADMSRSPTASKHLAGAALSLAVLFLWMKFCQAIFARSLRGRLAGTLPPPLSLRQCSWLFVSQALLQSLGLFLLPLALLLTVPFGWVYAFQQNVTALADRESVGFLHLVRKSLRQAALWPAENHALLAVVTGFGFCVFLNWATVCFLLPLVAKKLFAVESVFSRSEVSMLNSTFFAAMFGLTYLCLDPILKAVYVLRCFYGESLQSGEDLKAELRQFARAAQPVVAGLLVFFAFTGVCRGGSAFIASPRFEGRAETLRGQPANWAQVLSITPVSSESWRPLASATDSRSVLECGSSLPLWEGHAPQPPLNNYSLGVALPSEGEREVRAETSPLSFPPTTVSPQELDRTIQEVIQQRKYTWRMPREKAPDLDGAEKGPLARFLQRASELFRQWFTTFSNWLGKWLRKLFSRLGQVHPDGGSGYGWMTALYVLLYALVAAAAIALALLLFRIWRERQRRSSVVAGEPIMPAPDLLDENVGPDQLPEDGWTRLARELLERGELRLAMRAFYLASLAHLATRNLISLARFKSNRDYERELQRRGHAFPQLLSLFGENVSVFDRIWYGMHEITRELVGRFAQNVERIKGES